MFAFVDDFGEEGALDRIRGYGCTAVAVAAAYHQARDVTPHGPVRVTLRRDGLYFPVPDTLFAGQRLVPPVAATGSFGDVLASCAERGLAVFGWTVFLHNTTLGLAHPDVTQLNCFGEHAAPADLCPSHPDVRAYAVNLARAVAATGVSAIVAESLHFGFFGHGYHHERSFVELGPLADFLLGLCCCEFCQPPAVVVRQARDVVRRAMSGRPLRQELTMPNLAEFGGVELAAYVERRTERVTELVRDVAAALADEGRPLTYVDITGALKGYADGRPVGALAAHDAWRLGIDPAAISPLVDGYATLGYASDQRRIADDVRAYRTALGPDRELRVLLRPGLPDTRDAEHLAAKTRAARDAGADGVDFYNYGMTPLPALDRIPIAIAQDE
jgi:hypothetical protein